MKKEIIEFKEVNDKYFRGPSQQLEDGTQGNIYLQEGIIDWLVASQKKGEIPKGLRVNKKISINGKREDGYEYRFHLKDEFGNKNEIKIALSTENVNNWKLGKITNNRVQIFGKKILTASLTLVMSAGMTFGGLYAFLEAAEQAAIKSTAAYEEINQERLKNGMRTLQEEQQLYNEVLNKIKEEHPNVNISELDMSRIVADYLDTGHIHLSSKSR